MTNIVCHLKGFIGPEVHLNQEAYIDPMLTEECGLPCVQYIPVILIRN